MKKHRFEKLPLQRGYFTVSLNYQKRNSATTKTKRVKRVTKKKAAKKSSTVRNTSTFSFIPAARVAVTVGKTRISRIDNRQVRPRARQRASKPVFSTLYTPFAFFFERFFDGLLLPLLFSTALFTCVARVRSSEVPTSKPFFLSPLEVTVWRGKRSFVGMQRDHAFMWSTAFFKSLK